MSSTNMGKFFSASVFVLILGLAGCSSASPAKNDIADTLTPPPNEEAAPPANPQGELKIEDITEGTEEPVKNGDTVSVNYAGTLQDGTEFDSSYKRNEPFSFTVGQGQVISGWDQGLLGMRTGGKRKLTIPPNLAYGARAVGDKIPAQSTLVFEIELLKISQ